MSCQNKGSIQPTYFYNSNLSYRYILKVQNPLYLFQRTFVNLMLKLNCESSIYVA